MSDIQSRNFNTGFRGLITTAAIFAAIGGVALIGFETLRQLKRLPHVHYRSLRAEPNRGDRLEDRYERERIRARRRLWFGLGGSKDEAQRERELDAKAGRRLVNRDRYKMGLGTTPEDWEMGHLYMARQFHASTPSPPLAKWPLMWAWQALRFDDWFYATHTGMDTVVYVRFLRASCEGVTAARE